MPTDNKVLIGENHFTGIVPDPEFPLKEYKVLRSKSGGVIREETMTLDDLMTTTMINKIDSIDKLQDLKRLLSEMAVPIYISQTKIKYIKGSDFFDGQITLEDINKWRREARED